MGDSLQRRPDPRSWNRTAELFEAAVQVPVDRREAWLASAAADDPGIRDTVRRMLEADSEPAGLLAAGIGPAAHLVIEPEATLSPGTQVGAFDIIGVLGRGGMGTVYAAKDRHLDRPVALKFLQIRSGSGRDGAERLIAEARAASALDHPNVAPIYQVGESQDGRYFIAMPRFEGETLRARLESGPVPAAEAVRIARAVAAGLAAAHRAGIVHRDVTAANIFLTRDGSVKLLDFGIAALGGGRTRSDPAAGTLPYMSPEQARGEPTDARTDVWSLGVVIYRMITGELPFTARTPAETLAAIRAPEAAPRLRGRRGAPARLAQVVARALRKDRKARYADAGEMLDALEAVARHEGRAWAVGVAGLALAGFVLASPGIRGAGTPAGGPPALAVRTLAVLPPRSVLGDTSGRYLTEGIAGELTTRLAKLRRLRVKGPRAAAGASGADSPQQIGEALEVDYLVETSVRRRDTMAVISLRLVDAREGFQLWTDDYELVDADLLALHDSIARDVAVAVAGELSADERAALGARVTASPAAYDHFLRGNYLLAKRTPAAVADAMRLYAEAIRLDSRFAEAHAQAAYARVLFADWGWTHPSIAADRLLTEATALADRAVELEPASALSWRAQAYLFVARDPIRFSGAVPAFERSLAIDSVDAESHHQYGQTLMALGRYEDAVAAYLRALALDPMRPMTLVPLAAIAMQMDDPDAAIRWADSAVAVTRAVPAPYALAVRAHIALRMGDPQTALRDARRALDLDSSYPAPALSVAAAALHAAGDVEAGEAALMRLLASIDRGNPTPTDARFVASALFSMGRTDQALSLIERARPRGAQYWFYLQSTDFDPYRALPRFAAVERATDPR